jgi:steroid delta-isomerase-like uncharacterized protein
MSTDTNKAIVQRYTEQVWNQQRRDLFEEFIAENVVHHGIPASPRLEGMKQGYDMSLKASPDIQLTIEDAIAEGDKVVARWTGRGTHQGELLGIPGTGKQVTQSGVSIYRLADARIVELWFMADNMSLMQQLGVVPALDAT